MCFNGNNNTIVWNKKMEYIIYYNIKIKHKEMEKSV